MLPVLWLGLFMPAVGGFATPDSLGGAKSLMVGNLAQNQFLKTLNWPLGAALPVVLMVLILLPIGLSLRLGEPGNRGTFSG